MAFTIQPKANWCCLAVGLVGDSLVLTLPFAANLAAAVDTAGALLGVYQWVMGTPVLLSVLGELDVSELLEELGRERFWCVCFP